MDSVKLILFSYHKFVSDQKINIIMLNSAHISKPEASLNAVIQDINVCVYLYRKENVE